MSRLRGDPSGHLVGACGALLAGAWHSTKWNGLLGRKNGGKEEQSEDLYD
ncbi:MAG: hypothetical protein COB08_003935 [Rhodobacteraceae bacterium]|nr:hypothetical protein [Paracoccaceae bacterium]